MRMPRSQLGLDSDLEGRFLNTFVKLKQMRMRRANADPDNLHMTFWRKGPDAFDRQKECAEVDRFQLFAQGKIDILRHVREKTEGEMNLVGRCPAHAANIRIEFCQKLSNRWWRIDRNEQPLPVHFPRRISAPDRASLPLWLTCGGNERLNILITLAIRFGKTAFFAMMR